MSLVPIILSRNSGVPIANTMKKSPKPMNISPAQKSCSLLILIRVLQLFYLPGLCANRAERLLGGECSMQAMPRRPLKTAFSPHIGALLLAFVLLASGCGQQAKLAPLPADAVVLAF